MFDLESTIAGWRRDLVKAGINNSANLDELESHLRDLINVNLRNGCALEKSFEQAVKQLGTAPELQAEFLKSNRFWFTRHRHNSLGLKITVALLILGSAWPIITESLFAPFIGLHVTGDICRSLPHILLNIAIGIGLLHGNKLCRRIALAWTAFISCWCFSVLFLMIGFDFLIFHWLLYFNPADWLIATPFTLTYLIASLWTLCYLTHYSPFIALNRSKEIKNL